VRPLRRLRRTPALREAFAETRLAPADLVLPIFVQEGTSEPQPVASMPGVSRLPVKHAVRAAREAYDAGVRAVLLFGVPSRKDPLGLVADARNGVAQDAITAIKDDTPLAVFSDLCLCAYTDHGHCGVLSTDGGIDLPQTLQRYGEIAVAQARAGADVVAPSGRMDGQVRAIRSALDAAGFADVAILSYGAKFASAFYGPFREAAASAPSHGDRRSHQLPPANRREALAQMRADVDEGADAVMVKPALAYLDVVHAARQALDVPIAAYAVSGEYAAFRAAAQNGWLDGPAVAREALTSIKRAGADLVIAYDAIEVALALGETR